MMEDSGGGVGRCGVSLESGETTTYFLSLVPPTRKKPTTTPLPYLLLFFSLPPLFIMKTIWILNQMPLLVREYITGE